MIKEKGGHIFYEQANLGLSQELVDKADDNPLYLIILYLLQKHVIESWITVWSEISVLTT